MSAVMYSVIVALLMNACMYQCRVGTKGYFDPGSQGFSFSVEEQIKVEAGDCIEIYYRLTYPKNDANTPYKGMWFEGDHRHIIREEVLLNQETQTQGVFTQPGLPQGRYQYGFKLEWGDNQRRIFPERVHVNVSGLRKPSIQVPVLTEGRRALLTCSATPVCAGIPRVKWPHVRPGHDVRDSNIGRDVLSFTPAAEDHNTNITCAAVYPFRNTTETTVTLTVRSRPRFLNASRCVMSGELLRCVCVSQGIPLPVITWPLLRASSFVTAYALTGSGSGRTVNSTITAAVVPGKYPNSSVTCVSSNELGRVNIELPLQNGTVATMTPTCESVRTRTTWIIIAGVSLCVNVALLLYLIINTCRRVEEEKQKNRSEVNSTYATLDMADLEGPYSVIRPNGSTVL